MLWLSSALAIEAARAFSKRVSCGINPYVDENDRDSGDGNVVLWVNILVEEDDDDSCGINPYVDENDPDSGDGHAVLWVNILVEDDDDTSDGYALL